MSERIIGLHHITAIAGAAQQNHAFYTKTLGLRFVKKTVNFDDPGTYHFYYGNEQGSPGTILTFFPWEHVKKGHTGTGMATEIGYSVPKDALPFWKERFADQGVNHEDITERFGLQILPFTDPDGLNLSLIANDGDVRDPWAIPAIDTTNATRGFHSVTLTVRNAGPTARVLTDIFGYRQTKTEGKRLRFETDAADNANIVDIVESPTGIIGLVAGGTNHHVAFRVKNDDILMEFHDKVAAAGLHITEKIDRNYFYSLYFREPGGVLFEIATDNPGFTVDEDLNALGTGLKLPAQYEKNRETIEKRLPVIS